MGTGELIDDGSGTVTFTEGDDYPHILQDIRNLTEQFVNFLQAAGKQLMYPVFHRIFVTQVVNVYDFVYLADALDTPFMLFQTGRIPWKIQVDQGTQPLQIQSLAGRTGSQHEVDIADKDQFL